MKKLLAILVTTAFVGTAFAAAEKKEVCKDVLDKSGQVVKNKDGSVKQTCKTIKVHKKFEGTKIEDAKKAAPEKKK